MQIADDKIIPVPFAPGQHAFCVHGGLGSAVAEVLCQHQPVKMKILGLPDEKLFSGTSQEVFDHYGLTAEGIIKAVLEGR